jgi:hypothetical protein
MTNPLAIFLGLLVTILIITDIVLTDGLNLLFLARKFTEFTEWMAFWR